MPAQLFEKSELIAHLEYLLKEAEKAERHFKENNQTLAAARCHGRWETLKEVIELIQKKISPEDKQISLW